MRANAKSEATEAPRATSPMSLLSEWVQQGTSSFFATQRILLDLVTQQNAMTATAIRQTLAGVHLAPTTALTEITGEGVSNFIAGQKILLDLAHSQTNLVMKGVRERVGPATPVAAMSDVLRRSVGLVIHLQEHFLEVADKQTHAWVQAAKTGKSFTGEGLAELAKDGMDAFIESQKKFLDVVADEASKMEEESENGDRKPTRKTELTELARRSTDAFIEAQKRLLDVAGKQIEANLKAAGKAVEALPTIPTAPFADLARQGVESLTAAQKALMDVVSTRRGSAPRPRPAGVARGTRATHRKPA
jgi:hypothetical protein